MPRMIQTALLLLFSVTLVGCGGDTHEKLGDDALGVMDRMADILATVEDERTAEQAKDDLKALEDDFRALGERMEALGEPDAETDTRLREKFDPLMEASRDRFEAEVQRIMEIDLGLLMMLAEPMEELGQAAQESRPSWME